MHMQVSHGSLIGQNSATHWSQTIKTTVLYGVIEVESEDGDAVGIGKRAMDTLMQKFSNETISIESFDEHVKKILEKGVVSLIVFIPTGAVANIFIYGKGAIILKRDGHVAKILESEGSMSGVVNVGDMYVLATKTCFEKLSIQDIYGSFDHTHAGEVAEKLMIVLQKSEGAEGLAGLVLEIDALKEEQWTPEKAATVAQPIQKGIQLDGKKRISWYRVKNAIHRRMRVISHRFGDTTVRISAVLFIIFFISVVVGIRREMVNRGNNVVTQVVGDATRLVSEGTALLELNTIKSKEKLLEAKALLDANKENISPKTKEGRQVEELYKQIAENLPRATLSYDVTPELYFDAALQKPGVSIEKIDLTGDTLVLIDTKEKALMVLSVPTKKAQMLAGSATVDSAYCAALQGNYVYVATPDGINAVSIKDMSVKKSIIPKSTEWQTIQSCVAFGGNIYILDSGKNRIWKYISVESPGATTSGKFSDLREYLNPDTFPDFSKATSMSIDGSVWVGTNDGSVLKFTQGREDTFGVKGIDPPLGSELHLFTDDTSNNVYILDKGMKRVVVIDKEGMYKAQYSWGEGFVPISLVVSEKQGKILLLSGGKIYSIPLQ